MEEPFSEKQGRAGEARVLRASEVGMLLLDAMCSGGRGVRHWTRLSRGSMIAYSAEGERIT